MDKVFLALTGFRYLSVMLSLVLEMHSILKEDSVITSTISSHGYNRFTEPAYHLRLSRRTSLNPIYAVLIFSFTHLCILVGSYLQVIVIFVLRAKVRGRAVNVNKTWSLIYDLKLYHMRGITLKINYDYGFFQLIDMWLSDDKRL